MWKNFVQPCRPPMTIWRMRIACWIPKATNAQSEYIILSFLLQQWLQEHASMLRYPYTVCLVMLSLRHHFTSSDCHVCRPLWRDGRLCKWWLSGVAMMLRKLVLYDIWSSPCTMKGIKRERCPYVRFNRLSTSSSLHTWRHWHWYFTYWLSLLSSEDAWNKRARLIHQSLARSSYEQKHKVSTVDGRSSRQYSTHVSEIFVPGSRTSRCTLLFYQGKYLKINVNVFPTLFKFLSLYRLCFGRSLTIFR